MLKSGFQIQVVASKQSTGQEYSIVVYYQESWSRYRSGLTVSYAIIKNTG
jgi:hypothetical protein